MLCEQFLFFALLCGTFADMNSVPVFLVDNENVLSFSSAPVNPFAKLMSPEFMELLRHIKKRSSSVIVFTEDEFCAEDISTKDKLGSPFYHLRQGFADHKVKYFPSVTNPYEVLNQLFRQHDYNKFYLRHKTTKLPIYDNRYKYFYVFFEDAANETRVETLRRHDSIMKEVYQVIRQFHTGPVLAFYTGRTNPMVMAKSKHTPLSMKPYKRFVNSYTMVKFGDVSLLRAGKRWHLTDKIEKVAENYDTDTNTLQLKFIVENSGLDFNFKMDAKKWALDSIDWTEEDENVGNKKTNLCAPWNVSFACNEPIHINNKRDSSVITISTYQMEVVKEWLDGPVFRNPADRRKKFLRSIDCQPYFSATIVACLFVTLIFLTILTYGVLMLMDCASNDRYDDPQGKPLTIAETLH